jgi:signal peptidase
LIKKYDKDNKYVAKVGRKYLFYPLLVVFGIIVLLVSGIGEYKMIAVGSGSMEPTFYRGDAVIFKKISSIKELKVGMVLAYYKNNKLITHRITYINDNIINTKGDNNDNADEYDVLFNDVVGIVTYKISYIGYPTVWLNEKFGKL